METSKVKLHVDRKTKWETQPADADIDGTNQVATGKTPVGRRLPDWPGVSAGGIQTGLDNCTIMNVNVRTAQHVAQYDDIILIYDERCRTYCSFGFDNGMDMRVVPETVPCFQFYDFVPLGQLVKQ